MATFLSRWARPRYATLGVVVAVAGMLVQPAASPGYAAGAFDVLRAPGEPGFIAAHRGDRSGAPENTMPAFRAALDAGMAFVETDVRLSADGVPVLIHDPTVERTTDGTGRVAQLTLAELRRLDAGGWMAPAFRGTPVPTLDEFLQLLAERAGLALIELKGYWTTGQVRTVTERITGHGVHNQVILASFTHQTLVNIRGVTRELPVIVVRRTLPADPVALAHRYGAIAVLTKAKAIRARPTVVARMHRAGLGVLLYTLNSEQRWTDALALGVDGIVTDQPSDLDSWLAETAPDT